MTPREVFAYRLRPLLSQQADVQLLCPQAGVAEAIHNLQRQIVDPF